MTMDYKAFVEDQIASIRSSVRDHLAINVLSGGGGQFCGHGPGPPKLRQAAQDGLY